MKRYNIYQKGVVLVVALVMLLVMTVAGVTVMSGATLQERMAGNARQFASARANAESALRRAEAYLDGIALNNEVQLRTNFINAADSAGHYNPYPVDNTISEVGFNVLGYNWANTVGDSRVVAGLNASISPRYIIEYLGRFSDKGKEQTKISLDQEDKLRDVDLPFVFRITAIGYGTNQNIYSVLQSTYITEQ